MASRRGGGLGQLRPHGRCCSGIGGSIAGYSDLVAADALKQAPQEVLGKVVSAIDATVVADELFAVHLFLHLQTACSEPIHTHTYCKLRSADCRKSLARRTAFLKVIKVIAFLQRSSCLIVWRQCFSATLHANTGMHICILGNRWLCLSKKRAPREEIGR